MGIAENVGAMLKRSEHLQTQTAPVRRQFDELVSKGVIQKPTYDFPMVNVMGLGSQSVLTQVSQIK
jgi:hypothetical protein